MDGIGRMEDLPASAEPTSKPLPLGVSEAPDDLSDQFERLCAATFEAAGDYGIRWKEPEGRFVQALLGGMTMLNASSLRAERAFSAAARDAKMAAEGELRKVREVALAIEGAKQQARAAIELSRVDHQAELRRIVADTMPGLMDELRKVVVIREHSWNRDRARKVIRSAALWIIGVFFAGFALCLWMQWSDSNLGARCRSNLVHVEDRTYCLVSASQAKPGTTQGKEQTSP